MLALRLPPAVAGLVQPSASTRSSTSSPLDTMRPAAHNTFECHMTCETGGERVQCLVPSTTTHQHRVVRPGHSHEVLVSNDRISGSARCASFTVGGGTQAGEELERDCLFEQVRSAAVRKVETVQRRGQVVQPRFALLDLVENLSINSTSKDMWSTQCHPSRHSCGLPTHTRQQGGSGLLASTTRKLRDPRPQQSVCTPMAA